MVRMKDAISIVIPCHGGASTIERTIDSALGQNEGAVRLIVVIDEDCAVTDAILERVCDDRISVIRNRRTLGAPASRNIGLAKVQTPYVTFLDSDDFYLGDLIAPLVRQMAAEAADIGFGPSIWWNSQHGYTHHRIPRFRDQEDVFVKWFGKRVNVNTSAVVWRTDYVRAIGGWDEELHRNQDGDVALRAMLLGARFTQSSSGAGVWTNDRSLTRITTRTDNLDSLIRLVDKFLNMRSAAVPDLARIAACLDYCLVIAHLAYSNAQDAIGDQAMARRRERGVSDHQGDLLHVLSVSTRHLPIGLRMSAWRLIRSARDAVQRIGSTRESSIQRPATRAD